MLQLESVTWRYAGAREPSLLDVTLELAEGEVVGIVGPSEAGKSTLCMVAGGLAPRVVRGRLEGRVRIDGRDVADRPMHELAALVGSGLQDAGSQMSGISDTVFEEVAFGPANQGVSRSELIERVHAVLARLGIGELAARDPGRLSGGQQQLVAIAGLLAMEPRLLVLDEPTAQLDPRGTRLVMEAVAELRRQGLPVLVAEHKVDELARVCDRVIVLGGGRIVLEGTAAEVLANPALRGLGVAELAPMRLARLASAAGLDPATLGADA
jgi:energy-coupling factor transport system ATP-binding protein